MDMDTTVGRPGSAVRIGSLWYVVVSLLTLGLLTFLCLGAGSDQRWVRRICQISRAIES